MILYERENENGWATSTSNTYLCMLINTVCTFLKRIACYHRSEIASRHCSSGYKHDKCRVHQNLQGIYQGWEF